MKNQERVHKLIFGEVAPCGVDYSDVKKSGTHQVKSAYHWKNVTCKNCLATKK